MQLGKFLPSFILCYHQISEERLRSHVQFLKRHFTILPMEAFLAETLSNKGKKKGLLALTMDDCYEQDFLNAKKVCETEHVHCTFFLPVQYALESRCFWPNRLKLLFGKLNGNFENERGEQVAFANHAEKQALLRHYSTFYNQNDVQTAAIEQIVDGLYERNKIVEQKENPIISIETARSSKSQFVEFDSHTMTHPKLYQCDKEVLQFELDQSKSQLLEKLGSNSRFFCYPYGSDKHIGESWREVGNYYDYGFSLKRGAVHSRNNPLLLPRVDIYEQDNLPRLMAKLVLAGRQN